MGIFSNDRAVISVNPGYQGWVIIGKSLHFGEGCGDIKIGANQNRAPEKGQAEEAKQGIFEETVHDLYIY